MNIELMHESYAHEISAWAYEPPYDFYNMDDTDETIEELMGYCSVVQNQSLIGFLCIGQAARVPSDVGAYSGESGIVDIGLGLRPDLTGQGQGFGFVSFLIKYVEAECKPHQIRLTVAQFNTRATKLYHALGFVAQNEFSYNGTLFVVMTRKVMQKLLNANSV